MLEATRLSKECQRTTSSGGKGNRGMFIERGRHICAAGMPTAQGDMSVGSLMQQYRLQDEVNALIGDVIIPPQTPPKLLPLRHPIEPDQRHCKFNSEVYQLIRPPETTKFQDLVKELKDTVYKSYWKAALGETSYQVEKLPKDHIINTTHGIKTVRSESLYDLVMPKVPPPAETTNESKKLAYQTNRNNRPETFHADLTYGYKYNKTINKQGLCMKACLTDHRVPIGTSDCAHLNAIQVDLPYRRRVGLPNAAPPKPSSETPLPGFLTSGEMNPKVLFYRKCLAHLNSVRKGLYKILLPTFFKECYPKMKFYDQDNTEWLPKKIVYDYCTSKLIRFDPRLLEPLLSVWDIFDGENINYKTFFPVLNIKEPLKDIPKIPDFNPDSLDYRTTYNEMTKPGQLSDERKRAGVPSGRYLDLDYPNTRDGYCAAHKIVLTDENDMHSFLRPSILTLHNVSHRDMYAKREPWMVRKVFESAGEKFTDERFNQVWEEAKKYHSEGWVCFETFRRALKELTPTE